jgi:hypothetical protein
MDDKNSTRVIFGLIENKEPVAFLLDAKSPLEGCIMTYTSKGKYACMPMELFYKCTLALPFQYEELFNELALCENNPLKDETLWLIRTAGRKGYRG